jgi:hypothetical protein
MRKIAGTFAALGIAAALSFGPSAAPAQTPQPDGAPAVGVGIICNTSEQADHFVSLRAKGAAAGKAMRAINRQARDPRACGMAAVAFTRDKTLHIRRMGNRLVQIVRISVVAGYNGSAWQRVSGLMTQYAVIEGEGENV